MWIMKESLFGYAVQVWDKSMSNIKMKTAFCMWRTVAKLHLVDLQQMFMFTSSGFGDLQLYLSDIYGSVYVFCITQGAGYKWIC